MRSSRSVSRCLPSGRVAAGVVFVPGIGVQPLLFTGYRAGRMAALGARNDVGGGLWLPSATLI